MCIRDRVKSKCSKVANSCDLEFANANAACMECSNVVVKEGTLKSLSAFTFYILYSVGENSHYSSQ